MKTKPFLCLPLVMLSAAFALTMVLFLFGCAPQAGVAADADLSREQRGGQAGAAAIRYVAPEGEDEGDCSIPNSPCASVQYAVDQANAGDEVRIAGGTYTQVWHRPPPPGYAGEVSVITQCVYLSKSLTLRGGYTPSVDGGRGVDGLRPGCQPDCAGCTGARAGAVHRRRDQPDHRRAEAHRGECQLFRRCSWGRTRVLCWWGDLRHDSDCHHQPQRSDQQ